MADYMNRFLVIVLCTGVVLMGHADGEWGGMDSVFNMKLSGSVEEKKPNTVKGGEKVVAREATESATIIKGVEEEPQNEPATSFPYETAITLAVEGICSVAAKDLDCWFLPPQGKRVVVDWRKVTRTHTTRYRMATVKVPVYEYETYEVMEPGPSVGQLVKRKKQRVKGIKGYTEVERKVQDKNGPITETKTVTHRIPIYEKGDETVWHWGRIGANAMLLYALRTAGVPGDDGLLEPTAQGLADFVGSFEMPDGTWDLAWLTAAFAMMPGDNFAALTERCASKLMDGQITSGECAGMWGPISVNHGVVSVLLRAASQLSDHRAMATRAAQATPNANRKVQRQANRAEEDAARLEVALMDIQREANRASQCGLRMFEAMGSVTIKAFSGQVAHVVGHPYLFYNQTLVDMESTALSQFALRVAMENKRLPQKTWRPQLLVEGRSIAKPGDIPAPRSAPEVIRLGAQAVLRARQVNGSWGEVNRQQAISSFAWLESIPQVKGGLPQLGNTVSAVSSLRGLVAHNSVNFFQNMKPVPLPFENEVFANMVEEAAKPLAPLKNEVVLSRNCSRLETLALLFSSARLSGERTEGGLTPQWRKIADELLRIQNPKTSLWGSPTVPVTCFSSGIWARRSALSPIPPGKMFDHYPQAHLRAVLTHARPNFAGYQVPVWSINTAAALMIVAGGVSKGWVLEETEGVKYEVIEEG